MGTAKYSYSLNHLYLQAEESTELHLNNSTKCKIKHIIINTLFIMCLVQLQLDLIKFINRDMF